MPDATTDGWPMLDGDGNPVLVSGGPADGKPVLLSALWLVTFGKTLPTRRSRAWNSARPSRSR